MMKAFKNIGFSGILSVVLAMTASTAFAHHPVAAKFDPSQVMQVEGIVTKVDWRSPHVHLFVNINEGGQVLNWAVELENPSLLASSGWRENTLLPGDKVTVTGLRARDGSRQVWGEQVRMAETGHEVFTLKSANPEKPLSARPVPRWPGDNKPVLGAIPGGGASGLWGYPSKKALVEDGVNVAINDDGQLLNIRDAARVAPMQDWALALYRHRQERNLRDDPMYLDCKPPGGPRQYQSDLGFQLIEDKKNQRIFVLLGSGNRNFRIIYLDGRDPVGNVGGDDDNPLFYGRSVGHWEGDTLVVNTIGFNEGFWFTNGGLPHTNYLSMVEKFTRTNFDTLHYEVTIDDTGAYTRPWTVSWDLSWVGGQELPFSLCQHNRQ